MNKVMNILFLALFASVSALHAQTSDAIVGTWLTEEEDGKIEIYEEGGKYFGKLLWGARMYNEDGTSKNDVENPDKSLRSRPLKDLVFLTDFVFEDGEWKDGKIYDMESGKTYSCVMKLRENTLKVTGYIGFSWIGRTVKWTKIN